MSTTKITLTTELPQINKIATGGFMAIIDKASSLDNIDVDKLERMMAMQLQWEERQGEVELGDALSRIHAKLSTIRIIKTKSVGYDLVKGDPSKGQKEAFKYTPIEDIDKAVRPLLDAENIRPSYTMKNAGNGIYEIICRLSRGRNFVESSIFMPMDTSGGKNNAQGMGSAQQYGNRRSLCAALNIVTVGEDNDAQGAPITDEQAKEIKDGLQEAGLDVAKFLKNLKVDSVEQIPTKDYGRAISAIDAKKWRNLKEQKGKANAINS